MESKDGTWIMYGVSEDDPECLHTVDELIGYIEEVGFLPLFRNEIPGFSVEERTTEKYWWSEDSQRDPWVWREIIARRGDIAYGKFFHNKAGFISKKWFPYFANYRRAGYDFDARWDDEFASFRQKKIMDLFMDDRIDEESDVEFAAEKLDTAAQDGNVETLKNVLGSSPEVISSFVSAPVRMQTKALYPVENYGSAMAPFYSTLSIWVGGIILVAMMKVTASENLKRALAPLKPHQIYLGRYLLFLVLGLIQSGLICLGDLYFLGIQCEHPFLFLLAGWVSSVVYVNIIYTFTVSFGDVGKAICVVLLVMQVAGSGGTFPIEVAPEIFQKIYPFLPFTHSMTAMRECVAGFYQYTYWAELGIMCLFLLASLFLGLVLRKPVIRLNELFIEKLEDTKLM